MHEFSRRVRKNSIVLVPGHKKVVGGEVAFEARKLSGGNTDMQCELESPLGVVYNAIYILSR